MFKLREIKINCARCGFESTATGVHGVMPWDSVDGCDMVSWYGHHNCKDGGTGSFVSAEDYEKKEEMKNTGELYKGICKHDTNPESPLFYCNDCDAYRVDEVAKPSNNIPKIIDLIIELEKLSYKYLEKYIDDSDVDCLIEHGRVTNQLKECYKLLLFKGFKS